MYFARGSNINCGPVQIGVVSKPVYEFLICLSQAVELKTPPLECGWDFVTHF